MLKLTQGCEAPQSATLSFSHDHDPGITRVRRGKGWSFHLPCGTRIADKAELARLAAIAMPPAYQRCWFCVDPQGHIQATGYDARGRKQYRYHPQFRAGQDATKYALCAAFGEALPTMRAQIEAVLTDHTPTNRAPTRERCLAAIVRLLDIGHFRIGNEQYARSNRSFGISTLRKRHVNLHGNSIELSYRGKSGKMQNRILHDRALLQIVKGLADLSGQRLFQYVDELGTRHDIGSSDVNRYISEIMGAQFSAKHFRTWGGTLVRVRGMDRCGRRDHARCSYAPGCRRTWQHPDNQPQKLRPPRSHRRNQVGQTTFDDFAKSPATDQMAAIGGTRPCRIPARAGRRAGHACRRACMTARIPPIPTR